MIDLLNYTLDRPLKRLRVWTRTMLKFLKHYGVVLAVVILVASLSTNVIAEDIHFSEINELVGNKVKVIQPVPLRESPPSGFWFRPGKMVKELALMSEYKIVAVKTFPYVFTNQTWVLLIRLDNGKKLGWSYFGESTAKSENFASVD